MKLSTAWDDCERIERRNGAWYFVGTDLVALKSVRALESGAGRHLDQVRYPLDRFFEFHPRLPALEARLQFAI